MALSLIFYQTAVRPTNGAGPTRLRAASLPGHDWRDAALRGAPRALFVLTIANLKRARMLALDDDMAVLRAQFDLPNVSASGVHLLGDQAGALTQ